MNEVLGFLLADGQTKLAILDITASNWKENPCLWFNKGSYWVFSFFVNRCRIMSHEAGSCYYCLKTHEHPADAQTRSWEDNSKSKNVPLRDVHALSHPIHISLSHISKTVSVFICNESFIQLLVSHLFSQFITPSVARSACSGGSRLEAEGLRGMQGPAPGLDQSALQWFLLFGVCVFPEKLLLCCLPPILFLKHTHAHRDVFWM